MPEPDISNDLKHIVEDIATVIGRIAVLKNEGKTQAQNDLRELLMNFAHEVKRSAIEPVERTKNEKAIRIFQRGN